MFEGGKFDQVVPNEKVHSAVRSGFEKGKKEQQDLKRKKIIKRSSWSIVIAAILLISVVTSISVSPAFANKIASFPGMESIVTLIQQQDNSLIAAVEEDFYQSLNLSQEKNGIKVTLDGVIADRKGVVIFYTVQSRKKDQPLKVEYLNLMKEDYRNLPMFNTTFYDSDKPIIKDNVFSAMMTLEVMDNHIVGDGNFLWEIGLKNGNKVEHFQIPFEFKKSSFVSKTIALNKEVIIEGQRITVQKVILDPIRATVKLKVDPNNSKKIFSFQNLKFVNGTGDEWIINNKGTAFRNSDGTEWSITLQSPYFNDSDNLKLEFGKIAAIDKTDAYILIDTKSKKYLKQPSESIFSNLEVKDNKVSFLMDVNEEYNMLVSSSFQDNGGKEFFIKYDHTNPTRWKKYVNGSMEVVGKSLKLKFELPTESFVDPLKFDLDYYPSWIEGDAIVEIKTK